MGAVFEKLTEEELCDLMCGDPEDEWEDDEMGEMVEEKNNKIHWDVEIEDIDYSCLVTAKNAVTNEDITGYLMEGRDMKGSKVFAIESKDEDRICLVDKNTLKIIEPKSMSDPVSKVEMALKNCTNDIKTIAIKECKYLLPCGKCDKTDELCTQFEIITLKDKEKPNE